MYRSSGGNNEGTPDNDQSVEEELNRPAEREQLRRNLSLLKKKINSQAGSRRSQVGGEKIRKGGGGGVRGSRKITLMPGAAKRHEMQMDVRSPRC